MYMERDENILTFLAQEFNLEVSEVAGAMKKLNEENLIKKHPFEIWHCRTFTYRDKIVPQ